MSHWAKTAKNAIQCHTRRKRNSPSLQNRLQYTNDLFIRLPASPNGISILYCVNQISLGSFEWSREKICTGDGKARFLKSNFDRKISEFSIKTSFSTLQNVWEFSTRNFTSENKSFPSYDDKTMRDGWKYHLFIFFHITDGKFTFPLRCTEGVFRCSRESSKIYFDAI